MNKRLLLLFFVFGYLSTLSTALLSQQANWMFPNGNPEGTLRQNESSKPQDLSKWDIRWVNTDIRGDNQPLIGRIIDSAKYFNEIVSVFGGKLIVIDAFGKTHKLNSYSFPYINRVSALLDTISSEPGTSSSEILALGLETIEFENIYDTLGYAYIGGFDLLADTVKLLKRLAIDLRQFKPNYFSSIRPVFSKSTSGGYNVYATVNMSNPSINIADTTNNQYFRGVAVFNSTRSYPNFPTPDIGDDTTQRIYLGPEINVSQPSLSFLSSSSIPLLLPCFPSLNSNARDTNSLNEITYAKNSYLFDYNLSGAKIQESNKPFNFNKLIDSKSSRPLLKQYFVNLQDTTGADGIYKFSEGVYKIVTEEYTGLDGSVGNSKIYLFNTKDSNLTDTSKKVFPFLGKSNQGWTVAVGDVDGYNNNELKPWYPNNTGKEIIVTNSTSKLSVAENRLSILRYRTGSPVIKVSPPNTYLGAFDTIATQKINGWIAAVNDLDGGIDGKEEIVLADKSTIKVLRLKNYFDDSFRSGKPFDTVYIHTFQDETIFYASVADVDGDGRNDLVVTTNIGTYLIGYQAPGTLKITSPLPTVNPYCIDDTISIKWRANAKTPKEISLKYAPVVGGLIQIDSIKLIENIKVESDTGIISFLADKSFNGKDIKFILDPNDKNISADTSQIFQFLSDSLILTDFWTKKIAPCDPITISLKTGCHDTIRIEYSYNKIQWDSLNQWKVNRQTTDSFTTNMPYLSVNSENIARLRDTIFLRIIGLNKQYKDSSEIHRIYFLPDTIILTDFWTKKYSPCEPITFQGTAGCFDSVMIEYKNDSTAWKLINRSKIVKQTTFNIPADIPYLPVYSRKISKNDSVILFRIIRMNHSFSDTNNKLTFYDTSRTYSVIVNPDTIIINDFWSNITYVAGDNILFNGNSGCHDSVRIEYRIDTTSWLTLKLSAITGLGNYNLLGQIPCLQIFNCSPPDLDSLMYVRIIRINSIYNDTSGIYSVKVNPVTIPITLDSNTTANPDKIFRWNAIDIKYPCDSLTVSTSKDYGKTFSYLSKVKTLDGVFTWQVPLNLPDTLMLRFCCENSCVRVDTVIRGYIPKYINIVAPNPFNPENQALDIVYNVPSQLNVTIKILDESNRLVAEILNGVQRNPNTAYSDTWDGRLSNGNFAANGMYYISFELSNGQREVFPFFVRK